MSKKFLSIFIILIFYIIIIAYSDFNKFSENILQFHFEYLPLILGIIFASMLVKGIRQKFLLKKIGIELSTKNSIILYLAGMSMIITPGGSGELIKSYYLKKQNGYSQSKTFPLVFVERFYDLLAIVSIIFFTLIFFQIFESFIVATFALGFLAVVYFSMRSKKFFSFLSKFFIKIPKLSKFVKNIEESYSSFQSLTTSNIPKNWLLSLLAFGLDAIAVYFVFIGFGLDFDFVFTTMINFSSLLFGVLTLVPAGIGVTEVSFVSFLTQEGISLSLATSIIVMIRLTSIWFATGIGFFTTKLLLSKKFSDVECDIN